MALTPEQQQFKQEVDYFKIGTQEAIKEAQQLTITMNQHVKRLKKVEKIIRDMAREHNIG